MPRKPRSYIEPGVSRRVTRAEKAKTEPPPPPPPPAPPAQAPAVPKSKPKAEPFAIKAALKPAPKKKSVTKKSQAATKRSERKPGSRQGPAAKRVRGLLGAEESNAVAESAEDLPGIGNEAEATNDGHDHPAEDEEESSPAARGILTSSGYLYSSWPEAAAIISQRIGDDTSLEQFGFRPKNFIRRNIWVAGTEESIEEDTTSAVDTNTPVPAPEPIVSGNTATNNDTTTGARKTKRTGPAKKQLTTVVENSEAEPDGESSGMFCKLAARTSINTDHDVTAIAEADKESKEKETLDVIHVNTDNLSKQPTARRSSITRGTFKSTTQPSTESQASRPAVPSAAATQQVSGSRRPTRSSARALEQALTAISTITSVATPAPVPAMAPPPAKHQKKEPATKKKKKKKETMESQRPTKNSTRLQDATSEAPESIPSAVPATRPRWVEPPLVEDAGPHRQNRSSTRMSAPSLKRRLDTEEAPSIAPKRSKRSTGRQASPPMSADDVELDELQQAIQRAADVDAVIYQPRQVLHREDEGINSGKVQPHAAAVAASAEPQRGLDSPETVPGEAYCEPQQLKSVQNIDDHVLFFAYDRLMAEGHMRKDYSDDVVPCGIGKLEGWRFCLAGPRRLGRFHLTSLVCNPDETLFPGRID